MSMKELHTCTCLSTYDQSRYLDIWKNLVQTVKHNLSIELFEGGVGFKGFGVPF